MTIDITKNKWNKITATKARGCNNCEEQINIGEDYCRDYLGRRLCKACHNEQEDKTTF